MPGWHEATRELQESGRLQMVGVIQEQHADRCRLFMQWREMDWPVLVDSLNLLDVQVVPITLLIDELGVIRRVVPFRARPAEVLEEFLEAAPPPEATRPAARGSIPNVPGLRRLAEQGGAANWRAYGRALALWGDESRLDESIAAYEGAAELDPQHGQTEFRLGVLRRARYDSPHGEAADFERAIAHWSRALAIDPNNYIWRRRIQQYGPRLDKPYPFYDWVEQARADIAARGETPVELIAEPNGAELTGPSRSFEAAGEAEEPDAEGRIHRDEGKLIAVESTTVPPRVAAGGAARVHVEFRTRRESGAHWNNEARGLVLWIDPPSGWKVGSRRVELLNPIAATSDEVRRVEFEIQSPSDAAAPARLEAYALYYVCQGDDGPCLYRRQDIPIDLQIVAPDGGHSAGRLR